MTSDALADAMREQAAVERAQMEAAAWLIYRARLAGREADGCIDMLKQYLGLHPGEVVTDAEHGVYAELSRTSRTVWDLRPLSNAEVLALHKAGLLDVKGTAFDALRKAAPEARWDNIINHPGVRTASESWNLQVKAL